MNMQADYYAFSQGAAPQMAQAMMTPTTQMQAAVQAAYTAYGVGGVGVGGFMPFSGYPLGHTLPTHKHLEKIKTRSSKNKTTSSSGDVVVVGRSGSGANNNNKFDEITNSTDESIHLVRSRKTGESAPNRYDGQESQKKRSQSGNSLVKDSTILTQQQQEEIILQSQQGQSQSQSQSQRHRSHSDDRSLSPTAVAAGGVIGSAGSGGHHQSDSASNKAKTKRRSGKERKAHHHHRSHHKSSSVAQQWQQHYGDVTANSCVDQRIMEQYYVPASPYNVMPLQYGGQCCTPTQQGYTQGSAYTEQQQQQQWASEYQQQQAQQQQQQQQAQSYIQQQQEQYYGGNQWQPQPSGYDVAPGAPMPVDCSPYPGCVPAPQAYDPCQPNGGAGYGAPSPYYQQDPAAYCQDQYSQPSTSYQCYELPQQPGLPPGAKIVAEYFLGYLDDQPAAVQQQYQQQAYPGYPAPQSSSESSKEECEVEKDSFSEYEEERRTSKDDDLKKLKDDIIKTIQNELGNLKLDSGKDPIQPIFLMPKSNEQSQQKPIYIPRNIYVPVIRPVFVPRERIIVRPQIIHVARPVLVDRPVPIQQRPIVIERDRPVPVRVETIEKTEPLMMGHQANTSGVVVGSGVGASAGELTRNIETGQEVTYHEFTQTYPPPQSSGVNGPNGCVGQQTSQEYHHQSNYQFNDQGGSSADYLDDRKQNLASKSNEDLYQKYGGETTKTIESVLGSSQGYTLEVLDQRISNKFEKTDQETIKARYGVDSYQYLPPGSSQQQQHNNNNQGSEFYTTQQLGHSGSYKSLASVNNETRISNSNLYGRESGAIGVGAAPSYGGSVGSVDVTSSANVVYGGGSGGASSASPRASMNQSAQSQQHQNVQKIIQSYASYSNDQQNLDN